MTPNGEFPLVMGRPYCGYFCQKSPLPGGFIGVGARRSGIAESMQSLKQAWWYLVVLEMGRGSIFLIGPCLSPGERPQRGLQSQSERVAGQLSSSFSLRQTGIFRTQKS